MEFKRITSCRVCGSPRLKKYLDLGFQPLANALISKPGEVKKYPLQVLFCEECSLSQLSVVVDPEILYKNYPYHSSVSKTFQDHCYDMALTVSEVYGDGEKVLMDVAANDGCLLEQFEKTGEYHWLIGVEPSENLAKILKSKGFDARCEFYGSDQPLPKSNVITATNVMAHVDDVRGFVSGIARDLAIWKSMCVVEVPYVYDLLKGNEFDTIYHEHLSYFSFKAIKRLFSDCGLRIFRVDRLKIHGGSLRIYACRDEFTVDYYPEGYKKTGQKRDKDMVRSKRVSSEIIFPTHKSIREIEKFEEKNGVGVFKTYQKFSRSFWGVRESLIMLLRKIKRKGKTVVGYGASAKGISLLNYCNIDVSYIPAIVDETKAKQGKFTPGGNIPIVSKDHFDTTHPDYIALMSWNFAKELKSKTKHLGAKYITAIPEVTVE